MVCTFRFLMITLAAFFLISCHVYHPPIQQGNYLPEKAVNKIHKGMSLQALIDAVGTPVLNSLFADKRIVYVYTLKPTNGSLINKQLVVEIKNNTVSRFHFTANPSGNSETKKT